MLLYSILFITSSLILHMDISWVRVNQKFRLRNLHTFLVELRLKCVALLFLKPKLVLKKRTIICSFLGAGVRGRARARSQTQILRITNRSIDTPSNQGKEK